MDTPSLCLHSPAEEPSSCSAPPTICADLESFILRNHLPFPYFFLVALEAGSLLRAIALLLSFPFTWLLQTFAPAGHSASLQLLVFISCAGLRLPDVECVGRAVLPLFLAKDVRARAWKTFSSFPSSRRLLVSTLPRPMVESFSRYQLGVHQLIAPDLHVTSSGRCLGFLKPHRHFVNAYIHTPQLLIIPAPSHKYLSDLQFISNMKTEPDDEVASMADLQNPVLFHDGRLVQRPTPVVALMVFLWMPVGFILSVLRVFVCSRAPFRWWAIAARLFGIRLIVKGKVPAGTEGGLLLVSNHRTLLDPIFISLAMGRPVTAVTYSVSRLSEMMSPISTARLERDAEKDLRMLKGLIREGKNVVVCPEGTTSREETLLRFSALFAEVTDKIVPVAVRTRATVMHGTTARGWKAMDPFCFFMNPSPTYELIFLDQLPAAMTCMAGGKPRYEVANYVQHLIAATLNFQCSSYTRPDKYRLLAGTDGSVFNPSS